ncbi:Protein SGT1 [Tolypocladium capitatum]|uniref:Protein SGT1 n=1 Tax=Tolypocladium capitatum TaxID=45235 RepID=A0A2K3Q0L4_9HYPO|nr:Protein SGT1 [Tolypocladium capitatum]
MSHISIAQAGLESVEAKRWDVAVGKLSTALSISLNPAWLIARSKALVHTGLLEPALDDANLAWHKAYERNQRPLMTQAHYRRAVAFFRMGLLADSDCCCVYAMRLVKGLPALEEHDPKAMWTDKDGFWTATLEDAMEEARTDEFNRMGSTSGMGPARVHDVKVASTQVAEWRLASTLRMQILRTMAALPKDDPARKVTTRQFPEKTLLARLGFEEKPPPVPPPVPEDTPLHLQEFQSDIALYLSIFSKGVDKEKLKVEFLPSSVRLDAVTYPSGEEGEFYVELWDEIDPATSRYMVTPNKVELTLAKKRPGKWAQLKKDTTYRPAEEYVPDPSCISTKPSPPLEPPNRAAAPAYPSSSRRGPRDWDIIGADEADDDDEAGGANVFFKRLYKNATLEQRRAMMKSFVESNGTTLSTDWDDVKGRKVETMPPEGVEQKKWQ